MMAVREPCGAKRVVVSAALSIAMVCQSFPAFSQTNRNRQVEQGQNSDHGLLSYQVEFSVCRLLIPGFPPDEQASSGTYTTEMNGVEIDSGILPFFFMSIPRDLAKNLGLPTHVGQDELEAAVIEVTRKGDEALVGGRPLSDAARDFVRINCRPMNR